MADLNPIKYSDIVKPDNSINDAIAQLTSLKDTYSETMRMMASAASEYRDRLKPVSGAVNEHREFIKSTAEQATELFEAYKITAQALANVDSQIEALSKSLQNINKLTKEQAAARLANSKQELADAKVKTEAAKAELLQAKIRVENERKLAIEIRNSVAAQLAATKATKAHTIALSEEEKIQARLNQVSTQQFSTLFQLSQQLKENKKIKELDLIVNNQNADSYDRLSAEYQLLKINLNKYSQEVIDSSKYLSAQQQQAKLVYAEMSRLQEATGKHTLQVGNYRRAWNGLSVATSQVVRELPALAINLNTFFLAISNNIPILVDEIANLRAQNKALMAEGKETINIGKQVLKSLFSFNTVMVLLLTIFSVFGEKIFNWVGGLIKGKDATDKLTASQMGLYTANKTLADSLKSDSAYKAAIENIDKITTSLKKSKGSTELQKQALDEYNKTLGVTFGKADDVNSALKAIEKNEKGYIKAMENMAFANVFFAQSAEDAVKLMNVNLKSQQQILREGGHDAKNMYSEWKQLDDAIKESEASTARMREKFGNHVAQQQVDVSKWYNVDYITYKDAVEKRKELATNITALEQQERERQTNLITKHRDASLNEAQKYYEKYTDLFKQFKWSTQDVGDTRDPKGPKGPKGPTDLSIENANLKVLKEYRESITALEEDELIKMREKLKDEYLNESNMLMNKFKNEEKLTAESKDLILYTIANKAAKLNEELERLDVVEQQRKLNVERDTLDLEIELMVEGTKEYEEKRSQIIENARQQELIKNKLRAKAERIDEAKINAYYDDLQIQNSVSALETEFDIYQKYSESEFELIRRTEEEKTRFKLQQERERLVKLYALALVGAKKMSKMEIDTIKNQIAAIDNELKRLDLDSFDIWKLLGIKIDDEQKNALRESTQFFKENLNELLQAQIEMSQKAVEAATNELNGKRDRLEQEIEARNQGYANNVAQAEAEFQRAKREREQSLKEQRKYTQAQQALQTVEQTSSLITASANMWKAFSPLGPFGIGLALASIALMFGSFVGAKIKANQLTKQQEKYERGHFEILDGGSHASGNDISLGLTQSGNERRAEGGEAMMILNRKATAKYKYMLPDLFNALNNNRFESRFMPDTQQQVFSESTDIGKLESDVNAIRMHSERMYFKNSKGQLVERYKNLTKTYL